MSFIRSLCRRVSEWHDAQEWPSKHSDLSLSPGYPNEDRTKWASSSGAIRLQTDSLLPASNTLNSGLSYQQSPSTSLASSSYVQSASPYSCQQNSGPSTDVRPSAVSSFTDTEYAQPNFQQGVTHFPDWNDSQPKRIAGPPPTRSTSVLRKPVPPRRTLSILRKPVPTPTWEISKGRKARAVPDEYLPSVTDEPYLIRQTNTCSICAEELPHSDFLLPTLECAHDADYCRRCMQRMIAADLDSKGWDKIRCPGPKCRQKLSDADVRRHAPGETYARYSDFSMKAALSIMKDFHRCLNIRCTSGQIHPKSDGPLFVCHACNHMTCLHHNIPWHDGDTCKEYDYRMNGKLKRKEEEASEATKKKITKLCPSCQAPIQKTTGCDHMRCFICCYEFCWTCMADYDRIRKDGNAFHEKHCKFYA